LHHLSLFYSTAIFNNDTAAALLKEKWDFLAQIKFYNLMLLFFKNLVLTLDLVEHSYGGKTGQKFRVASYKNNDNLYQDSLNTPNCSKEIHERKHFFIVRNLVWIEPKIYLSDNFIFLRHGKIVVVIKNVVEKFVKFFYLSVPIIDSLVLIKSEPMATISIAPWS
jgi:hypothetical protein